uniref:phospholipase A2 inhibitor and Ly6/PLAUR domain-containing protein-like n=1 Tax=Podarcis muralis TaxID=64176 RepID=UPI0010A077BB|nr:phospholipase A2 inhibitor and Ly6/PLAUR domain-containing protein-like [Podarcis muralis]
MSCEVCIAGGEMCCGKMQPCFLGEDTCASILGETTLGVVAFAGALKSCTGHRACKAGIRTMTLGPGIMLRRSAMCCKRESCQKQLAKLPPVNTTRNGFTCPACYAKDSHSCEAEGSMDCTGTEDHCVHITGILESVEVAANERFAARGCAVPSVCEHSKGMAVFAGVYTYTLSTVRECYAAPSAKNAACLHHQHSWLGTLFLCTLLLPVSSFCVPPSLSSWLIKCFT